MGPLTMALLAAAIVAAFVKSALEQRARQLQRAAGVRGDEADAPGSEEADRLAEVARGIPDRPRLAAEKAVSRARLWRALFYILALGALASAVAGW